MGIYKSLTDAWMLKLGLRPRYSFTGNICFEISVFCLCRVCTLLDRPRVLGLLSQLVGLPTILSIVLLLVLPDPPHKIHFSTTSEVCLQYIADQEGILRYIVL